MKEREKERKRKREKKGKELVRDILFFTKVFADQEIILCNNGDGEIIKCVLAAVVLYIVMLQVVCIGSIESKKRN